TPRSSRPFMPTDYVAVKPACLTLLICVLTLRCLNGERTEQSMSDMARPSAEEVLDDEQFSQCPRSTGLWRERPNRSDGLDLSASAPVPMARACSGPLNAPLPPTRRREARRSPRCGQTPARPTR